MNNKIYKILTLDGGGSKGIFTLGVLHEVEAKVGKPLSNYFDYFCGCSTGSIIAAAFAKGKEVAEIRDLYLSFIPSIMNQRTSKKRTEALKKLLDSEFENDTFESMLKPIAIVTSSLDEKKVKIFKSTRSVALGRKDSFKAGWGFPVRDALLASCSAFPFFEKSKLVNEAEGIDFCLMDGGFSAPNPTLFAMIDVLKGLQLNKEDVRILSIGTGNFPFAADRFRLLTLFPYMLTQKFIGEIMDISANTIELVAKYLCNDVKVVRINKNFVDKLSTSFLESNVTKLRKMYDLGKSTFGEFEPEFISAFIEK